MESRRDGADGRFAGRPTARNWQGSRLARPTEERVNEECAGFRDRREKTGSSFARRRCLEKGEGVLKGRFGAKRHEAEPKEREDRDHGFERAPARVSEHT
jgi:hypothetical protein